MKSNSSCERGLFRRAALLLLLSLSFHASATSYDGYWEGFYQYGPAPTRIELHMSQAEGSPTGFLNLPDIGLYAVAVEVEPLTDRAFNATTPAGPLMAALSADGTRLMIVATDSMGATQSIEMQRDHPLLRKYRIPRLDEHGKEVLEYSYRQPAVTGDGWRVAAPLEVQKAQLSTLMERVLSGSAGHVDGLVVAQDGRLILDEYFYGHREDRLHTVQSVTKSITAFLVGDVISRNPDLSLDEPVYRFFKKYPDMPWVREKYPVTLWHLLTMSAAIDWNEALPYADPLNSNTQMNASPDWIAFVLARELTREPGVNSHYTSGLSILLGAIVKEVTSQYIDDWARSGLFSKLAIQGFEWSQAADGTRHTGGGLSLRTRDLAKFGQLVLDEGQWQGEQLLDSDFITAATARQLGLSEAPEDQSFGYGYQWWIREQAVAGTTYHTINGFGHGGQLLCVVPALNLVIAMNATEFVQSPGFDMDEIVADLIAVSASK